MSDPFTSKSHEVTKYDDLYGSAIVLADGIEIDADKQAHLSFQSDLYTLRDQIQEIVDAGREASETLKNDQTKESRLKQLGDKFDAAYNRVDTALAEMKTGLTDAETVFSLDLLNYKSEQLELLRNQMNVADSHVEALFTINLEQETVTVANLNIP